MITSAGIPAPSAATSAPAAWLSARATARRVSAEASGPSAVSASPSDRAVRPSRWAKVLAMSSRCAKPVEPGGILVGEAFGAGGRHSGSPSRFRPRHAADVAGESGARADGDDPFARPLELGALRRPRLRAPRPAPWPAPSDRRRCRGSAAPAVDQRRRRLVGDEVAGELGRDVPRGRRDGARGRRAPRGPARRRCRG